MTKTENCQITIFSQLKTEAELMDDSFIDGSFQGSLKKTPPTRS